MLLMSLSASTLLYAKKKNNNDYDVYLLIGQSNMAATNKMKLLPSDTTEIIPGVWLLNDKDIPEPAKNPLNRYSSVWSVDRYLLNVSCINGSIRISMYASSLRLCFVFALLYPIIPFL